LVSDKLTNLIGGVSQQSDALRLPSQSGAETNSWLDPVQGNTKRPPVQWLKALDFGTSPDFTMSGSYFARRDASQKHIIFGPGRSHAHKAELRAFDLAGNLKTINYAQRVLYLQNLATGVGDGIEIQVWVPSNVTTIKLESQISGATITWERSADAAFTSPTVLRTDTVSTAGSVAFDPATQNGHYVRGRISAYTSGNCNAILTWKDTSYLMPENDTPGEDDYLRFQTVADHTFILNRDKTVAKSSVQDAVQDPEAIVWVKQGAADTQYEITVDGTLRASYTTTSTQTDTKDIADDLFSDLDASIGSTGTGDFTIAQEGNVIYLTRVNNAAFDIAVTDGLGDRGLILAKGKIQKFSDLPPKAPDGFQIEVVGDVEEEGDNYFLKFFDNGTGEGRWEEVAAPGLYNRLDETTLPYKLIYTAATDDFDYEPSVWGKRDAGDATTAPDPSFVGKKIRAITFFRNRLCFAADEGLICSRNGDFFEFYRESAALLLDTDPIDILATEQQVAILEHLTPWDKKLIAWADGVQLIIDPGRELFTPETATLKAITWEACDASTPPVVVGDRVYFANKSNGFVTVKEIYLADEFDSTVDVFDTTAHVPKYVTCDACNRAVRMMTGNSDTEMLFTIGDDNLFVYKFLFGGQTNHERLQTSWSSWHVGTEDSATADQKVQGVYVDNDTLYLVVLDSAGNYWLGSAVLNQGATTGTMPWVVHLDRREKLGGVYSAADDWTTWTLTQAADADLTFEVVLSEDWTDANTGLRLVNATRPSATTVRVAGDWSAFDAYVGQPYVWSREFSTIFYREGSQGQTRTSGTLKLKTMEVGFTNTGYLKATVAMQSRAANYVYELTPTIGGFSLSPPPLLREAGFRFPIGCENIDATVTLSNDTPMPSVVHTAEWEGSFNSRSRRVRAE
jgi:hypothetical protein